MGTNAIVFNNKAKVLAVLLLLLLYFISGISAQKNAVEGHRVQIIFQNKIDQGLLELDQSYTNLFGEIFTITKLKYYISGIRLNGNKESKFQEYMDDYFLVNEEDADSKYISLISYLDTITSIHFRIGIDSLRNTTGVQTGALDPAKGMFWVWNTGYIMAKLEGLSPAANTPGKSFSYDVGGYKTNENTARDITLSLEPSVYKNPDTIQINADIAKWFYGSHPIKISSIPFCHAPGNLAMQIADNYSTMFTIAPKN